jgi:hypothetical protein
MQRIINIKRIGEENDYYSIRTFGEGWNSTRN